MSFFIEVTQQDSRSAIVEAGKIERIIDNGGVGCAIYFAGNPEPMHVGELFSELWAALTGQRE